MTGRPDLAARYLAAGYLFESRAETSAKVRRRRPWRVFERAATAAALEAAFYLHRSQGDDAGPIDVPTAVDNAAAWALLDERTRRAFAGAAGRNGGAS